ncbi:hypothetical protein AIOL_003342 [Candidatus Rhodobacter oscarellae]|uniref:Hedgehog/Intein (Hint) domain-containing protein n=2 Tax=Candidatus Rhodobacter oscarellae TaxID=1675527 RepID=A0A0J9E9M4_9RHOB|nr:hypothetical protein AIOL_003342 [Candidatus Rhodobacter lobularis]
MTAIGDPLDWDISASTAVFWGFFGAGDPIIRVATLTDGTFDFYVLSNDPVLTGTVGFNPSGVYQYCFAAGTGIAVPNGETPVERLCIGDALALADGRTARVRWVGRQTISKLFSGQRSSLVRIAAGALSHRQPHRDLYVTGDHGMILDGYIVNASALVNGGTIDWVGLADTPDRQTVYHIETEDHDVILANGAPSETYLDAPGRRAFDNYQEYLDLYSAERTIAESPLPRISSARLLPGHLRVPMAA